MMAKRMKTTGSPAASSGQSPRDLLAPRALTEPDQPLRTVLAKSPTSHPFLYRKRLERIDPDLQAGDLARVLYGEGQILGYGLFNPRAEIAVRMLRWGEALPDADFWRDLLIRAVSLRRDLLRLPEVTDACRLIHAEADGLSGLVVDQYGETLSAEVYSLAMYQRVGAILEMLLEITGAKHWRVRVAPPAHGQEGFWAEPTDSPQAPAQVTIQEFGTRFRVDFAGGHKTGFFCDQRDNRRQLASFARDRSVLDLCCYTGGFAVQAAKLGQAREVTAVDLDEDPLRIAKQNANLNQVRVHFVQADVFSYMRDLVKNGRQYEVVILDPPKLIRSRHELEEGTRAHFDLNRLALQLVKPGGLLLTCSCSGLLNEEAFVKLLHSAAQKAVPQEAATDSENTTRPSGRRIQILGKSGAAADHPVVTNCLETEYLRSFWLRVT